MPSAAARQYVFRLKGRHFIHLFHKINKIFPLNKIFTDIFFLIAIFTRENAPPKKSPIISKIILHICLIAYKTEAISLPN